MEGGGGRREGQSSSWSWASLSSTCDHSPLVHQMRNKAARYFPLWLWFRVTRELEPRQLDGPRSRADPHGHQVEDLWAWEITSQTPNTIYFSKGGEILGLKVWSIIHNFLNVDNCMTKGGKICTVKFLPSVIQNTSLPTPIYSSFSHSDLCINLIFLDYGKQEEQFLSLM